MPTPITAAERAALAAARATLEQIGRRITTAPEMHTLAETAGLLDHILGDAARYPALEADLATTDDAALRQEERWLTTRLTTGQDDLARIEADMARLHAVQEERWRRGGEPEPSVARLIEGASRATESYGDDELERWAAQHGPRRCPEE